MIMKISTFWIFTFDEYDFNDNAYMSFLKFEQKLCFRIIYHIPSNKSPGTYIYSYYM